jgi:hypothetical protein
MNTPEKAKIVTTWNGLGWTAVRDDYDLGMPVGSSTVSEQEAIEELLAWEDMQEEDAAAPDLIKAELVP